MGAISLSDWSARKGHATVEVTNFCDLRCIYCYQSDPRYVRRRNNPEVIDRIITELCDLGVPHVTLVGAGEVTTYKGWEKLALKLRSAGVQYSLTSNFSHSYTEAEIDVLANASELTVSFDTYDPILHGRMRRGSKLFVILENLRRISARSAKCETKPFITQNCVLAYENLAGLPALPENAASYGINRVALLYMIDGQKIAGYFQVSELMINGEVREGVVEAIAAFRKTASARGVDVFISQIIIDIERAAAAEAQRSSDPPPAISATLQGSLTRQCVAPWRSIYITNEQRAGPCCFLSDYLGEIGEQKLVDLVHSNAMTSLQDALLTGDLENSVLPAVRNICATCPIYGWGEIADLRAKLEI